MARLRMHSCRSRSRLVVVTKAFRYRRNWKMKRCLDNWTCALHQTFNCRLARPKGKTLGRYLTWEKSLSPPGFHPREALMFLEFPFPPTLWVIPSGQACSASRVNRTLVGKINCLVRDFQNPPYVLLRWTQMHFGWGS